MLFYYNHLNNLNMKTKEIKTETSVNWVYLDKDGTVSYFGKLAVKFLFNPKLIEILEKIRDARHSTGCYLFVIDLSVEDNPYLVAVQKSQRQAESYMNSERVLIIKEQTEADS